MAVFLPTRHTGNDFLLKGGLTGEKVGKVGKALPTSYLGSP